MADFYKRAMLGLGCYFSRPIDDPVAIIRRAVSRGICIFDTSPAYGDSETHLGNALSSHSRDSVAIWTKTKAASSSELELSINDSLCKLKTDRVDILWGHSFIDDEQTFESRLHILDLLREYKSKKIVNEIGVSGHSVEAATRAIRSGIVDAIMVPHSISHRRFDCVIDEARNAKIKIVTMKNFASGVLLGGFAKNSFNETVSMQDIVNFSAFGADIIIPAARSVVQLDEILDCYSASRKLSNGEIAEIEMKIVNALGNKFCRSCNECRPCVKYGWQMSQSGILRALLYHEKFGIDMTNVYRSFKYNALDCKGCDNLCAPACSHKIDIKAELERAHVVFSKV